MTERYQRKAALGAAFLITLGALATVADASMNISPVRVFLSADNDKEVVSISNQASTPVSYEVEVVEWTQTDEKREVYLPTDDLVAVPPLFTLDPGDEQIIRIGMLTEVDPTVEKSYRMFVTEIASPAEQETSGAGIQMRIQVGVPVFVSPIALTSVSLQFVEARTIGDQDFMRFRNTGNGHVKISEVRYSGSGIEEETVSPAVGYILPGKTGMLPVDMPNGTQSGTLTIVTENVGDLEYALPLAP